MDIKTIKEQIAAVIRNNGRREITGDVLQKQLFDILDAVNIGKEDAGVAVLKTAIAQELGESADKVMSQKAINAFATQVTQYLAAFEKSLSEALLEERKIIDAYGKSIHANIDAEVTNREKAVAAEEKDRKAKDTALESALAEEISARQAADADEKAAREGEDKSLSDRIYQETRERSRVETEIKASVETVDDKVNAEVTRATDADKILSASLSTETARAQKKEGELATRIEEAKDEVVHYGETTPKDGTPIWVDPSKDYEPLDDLNEIKEAIAERERAERAQYMMMLEQIPSGKTYIFITTNGGTNAVITSTAREQVLVDTALQVYPDADNVTTSAVIVSKGGKYRLVRKNAAITSLDLYLRDGSYAEIMELRNAERVYAYVRSASLRYFLQGFGNLKNLELNSDFSKTTDLYQAFVSCNKLANITGYVANLKQNISFVYSPLTRESALVFINGLYDFTADEDYDSSVTHTLTLSSTTKVLLTDADKAIAAKRGWSIA